MVRRKYLHGDPRAERASATSAYEPAPVAPDIRTRRERRKDDRKSDKAMKAGQRERVAERNASMLLNDKGEPMSPREKLSHDVKMAQDQYLHDVSVQTMYDRKKSREARYKSLGEMHQQYVKTIALSCVAPLGAGLNPRSVAQVATMGAMLWVLSPNMRGMVGGSVSTARNAAVDYVEDRIETRIQRAERDTPGHEDSVAKGWRMALDRVQNVQRGGRDPYTAYSAGMTEVALTQNAYWAMRQPGANVAQVRMEYDQDIAMLYEMAGTDGITPEALARSSRIVVGQLMAEAPATGAVFSELASGDFTKADYREVTDVATGTVRKVWDGRFERRDGSVADSGSFSLRAPQGMHEHLTSIEHQIADDLLRCNSVEDMHTALLTYATMGTHVDKSGNARNEDFIKDESIPFSWRNRVQTIHIMQNAAASDGLGDKAAQYVYSNAFIRALDDVKEKIPGIEAEWSARYGANWRHDFETMANNPDNFADAWKRQAGKDRGPTPTAAHAPHARPHERTTGPQQADGRAARPTPGGVDTVVEGEVLDPGDKGYEPNTTTEQNTARDARINHRFNDEKISESFLSHDGPDDLNDMGRDSDSFSPSM